MIAGFFKQSKPFVHILLGSLLSLYFMVEVIKNMPEDLGWSFIVLIALKYIFMMISYVLFNHFVSFFEIEKTHSFSALIWVLLSSFFMPEIVSSNIIFGFVILNFGVWRLLSVTKSDNIISCIFDATFLIVVSSLFFPPFGYFLLLILAATLIFITPKWKYFIVPIISVSAFVVLAEMYSLFSSEMALGYHFFLPKLTYFSFGNYNKTSAITLIVWLVIAFLSVYQIILIKRKRSLYKKEMASFFLSFIVLAFIIFAISKASVSELWLLSLWPLSIYLGFFLSKVTHKLKLELLFWAFVILSLAYMI